MKVKVILCYDRLVGELEIAYRKRRKRQNIEKIVLGTIKVTGIMAFALLAPNALRVLEQIDPSYKRRKKNPKYTVNNSISKLLDRKLITFEVTPKGKFIRLTELGKSRLKTLDLERVLPYQKKKKWDKRWRVIIFDIKEERRAVRDKIRGQLEKIGFYKLQNSVWVYPYDCENLIKMIKADLRIGKDVLYIIADTIENDRVVKQHFELK